MLRLHLLGPLEVGRTDRIDGGDVLAQPKRFALLAYLAVSAGLYQRRDTLLALLWPELDEFAARRALRQTLHQLRRALGDDVFVTRGDDEVMVDREAVWCDIVALREAVQGERFDEAIALYRGQLLEGFHVSNVGEGFDTWLERERAHAAALALRALDAVVVRHEREGRASEAALVAVRATELSPFDEPRLRRAVNALESSGDRGGALRLGDAFVARLATELEARPSAETRALMDRLRLSNTRTPAARAIVPATEPPPAALPPAIATITEEPAPAASQPSRLSRPSRPSRPSRRTMLIVAAALIAVGTFALRAWPHARVAGRERVLVTQFENRTGDSTLDPLGDMEADWLARGIVAAQFVDVVDPRALFARGRARNGDPANPQELARRTGAAYVITGSYYRSADSVVFFAGIIDADGRVMRSVGPLAFQSSRAVDGVEAIRTRVMASLASIIDPHARGRFDIQESPPPYDAYQAFIAAFDAFWLSQFKKSESLFVVAASRDSTFHAASIGLATAAANVRDCEVVDSVSRTMTTRMQRLSDVDRLDVRIAVARCHGRNDEMFRLVMLRSRSLSASSQWQLSAAAAADWANRPGDALSILERINPAVDLDWLPQADHFAYWDALTGAYHLLGRHDVELEVANRSHVAGLDGQLCRGRALVGLGRGAEAVSLIDSTFTLPSEPGLTTGMLPTTDGRPEYSGSAAWVALWVARELSVHGDSVSGTAVARRAVTWIDALPREDRDAYEMRAFRAQFLEQAGAFAAAKQDVQRLIDDDTANVDYRGIMAGLAAESGDSAQADRLDAWLASLPPARALWAASFYRARLASLRGRPADAVAFVHETLEKGAWPFWIHIDPALHRLATRADYIALTKPRS